jgi:uncharacterized repeat protein (TIGR03943 family)
MNRETQSLLLLLVGGAVLRISLTDVYLRYVKEGLRPFLIVSAGMLLVIGAITLWREIAERMRTADTTHGHSGPWVAWLLVLPVFAIFLIAPPSLGSDAAARAGTSVPVPENTDYPPLPPGDPAPLTVLDYATRAVFEGDASLRGRTVQLSGFTSPREGGGVRLNRIILSCCAADGRPVKVTMVGELSRELPADTWVEVQGRYDPRVDSDPANGEKIPYLRVSSLREIDKPTNPYEE